MKISFIIRGGDVEEVEEVHHHQINAIRNSSDLLESHKGDR